MQHISRNLTTQPGNSSRSTRRRGTAYSSLRLSPSQPVQGASQRGVARHSTANLDEAFLFHPSSDVPHPPCISPDPVQEEYAGEAEMNRRQRKRRRLELASGEVAAHQYLPYGHNGQVVPGPLQLDVVDVNTHESNTCKDSRYQAKILRRNWSVYSTQTDHCDVILGHKERVPFNLTKIVIKVPIASTYRQPSARPISLILHRTMLIIYSISEGLLFVAMTASEFSRTVHYRLRSTTLSTLRLSRPNRFQGADPTQGRGTYFQFHDRPPSRRSDNVLIYGTHYNPQNTDPPVVAGLQQLGSHWVRPLTRTNRRSAPEPSSPRRVLSPPIPDSQFQVDVAHDNISSDSEYLSGDDSEESTASGQPTPERRSRARSDTPRPSFSPTPPPAEDSEDENESNVFYQRLRSEPADRASDLIRSTATNQGTTHHLMNVVNSSRRQRLRLNKEGDSVGGTYEWSEKDQIWREPGILRPHARFFFEKGKTKVSVHLDPPV